MPETGTNIYTIVATGVDVDSGFFPDVGVWGSYLSRSKALERLEQLITEGKEELDERYNAETRCEGSWEAYEDGYAAHLFTRLEILTSELDTALPTGQTADMHASLNLNAEYDRRM